MICNRRFEHQIKLHLCKHRCTRNCCDCHITGFYKGLILPVHCNTCTFTPQKTNKHKCHYKAISTLPCDSFNLKMVSECMSLCTLQVEVRKVPLCISVDEVQNSRLFWEATAPSMASKVQGMESKGGRLKPCFSSSFPPSFAIIFFVSLFCFDTTSYLKTLNIPECSRTTMHLRDKEPISAQKTSHKHLSWLW